MDLFLKCLCIFFFFQMIVLMKLTNSKELFGHLKRHRLMCLYSTQPHKSPEEEQLCSHRYRPWEPNKSASTCFNISGTKRLACLNRFSLDRARARPGQARPGQSQVFNISRLQHDDWRLCTLQCVYIFLSVQLWPDALRLIHISTLGNATLVVSK